MRAILVIGSLLLFAGFAAAEDNVPSAAPMTDIEPAAEPNPPLFEDPFAEAVELACFAWADCGSHANVSCYTSGSGSCQGVHRNCSAGERGYARCGSTYKYCPSLGCTCGAKRWVNTNQCNTQYNLYIWKEQTCVNESWQDNGNTDLLVQCGGGGPL